MPTKCARAFTLTKIIFPRRLFSSRKLAIWFPAIEIQPCSRDSRISQELQLYFAGLTELEFPIDPKSKPENHASTCQREDEGSSKYFPLHFPDSHRLCCYPKWNQVSTHDVLFEKLELSYLRSRIKSNKNSFKSELLRAAEVSNSCKIFLRFFPVTLKIKPICMIVLARRSSGQKEIDF